MHRSGSRTMSFDIHIYTHTYTVENNNKKRRTCVRCADIYIYGVSVNSYI